MTGFIGGGNMAEAIIEGMVSHGDRDIIVSEPRAERRDFLQKKLGVRTTEDNAEAVRASGLVVLAVKPQDMVAVLAGLRGALGAETTVVSIAAGITMEYLKDGLGTEKLIRVMPNMGARVGKGMAAIAVCEGAAAPDVDRVKEIFMASGKVVMVPESQMDAVTALSGSGPAFFALFVGAMAGAGQRAGLSAHDAHALAVQTAVGTARLLDEGLSPGDLIASVRSPGGTTAAGLEVFGSGGFEEMVARALEAARQRASELAR